MSNHTSTPTREPYEDEYGILSERHRQMLKDSGVSPEYAVARGYRTVTVKAEMKRLGFSETQKHLVPALVIPIFSVFGEVALRQLRADDPRMVRGKTSKYEMPHGTKLAVDVPPLVRANLREADIPLVITEGSKKADAACSKGLTCIALLGVWNFRDKSGMLGEWESIALKGRKVHIAFDSDVMTKVEVHAAMERLSEALKARGANVSFIYLPAGPNGEKVGLDDFLATDGTTIDDLFALASPDLLRPVAETVQEQVEEYEPPEVATLADVHDAADKILELNGDYGPLDAVLATAAAIQYDTKAVPSLAVIGGSGTGKTVIVEWLDDLPWVHVRSKITSAGLISGVAKKSWDESATGGLLMRIGDTPSVLVLKDFTTTLSQGADDKRRILAVLREAVDGHYELETGDSGGVHAEWHGRLGTIIATTDVIDTEHRTIQQMGQRWISIRVHQDDDTRDAIAERAVSDEANGLVHHGDLNTDVRRKVAGLIYGIAERVPMPEVPAVIAEGIAGVAKVVVLARSPVKSGPSGTIESIMEPESPARIGRQLTATYRGAVAIGLSPAEAWSLIVRVMGDTIPPLRWAIMQLLRSSGEQHASMISFELDAPNSTVTYHLRALHGHGVVRRPRMSGGGSEIPYHLSPKIARWLDEIDEVSEQVARMALPQTVDVEVAEFVADQPEGNGDTEVRERFRQSVRTAAEPKSEDGEVWL